jgi:hypothetical protein
MPPTWAEIEGAASTTQQRSRPIRSGYVIAAAAAVVVLILLVIPALLFGGTNPPADDEQPTTTNSDSVTTTATPTTLAIEGLAPVTSWTRVGGEVMAPVAGMFSMTSTSNGIIAVGFDPGEEDFRQNGAVFMSKDGLTWIRHGEDDPDLNLGAILMYGVTEGGPGYVAVGMGCEDDTAPCAAYPTVWTSIDGTEWTRSGPDPVVFGESGAMLDVIETQHGLLAAGTIGSDGPDGAYLSAPAVWLSQDGLTWERVLDGEPTDVSTISPGINALTEGPDGRVLAVGEIMATDGTLMAGVWMSNDGRTWEHVNDPALVTRTGKHLAMFDVVHGPTGFVAVGNEGNADAAIWHSIDGLTWTRVDTTAQAFGGTESLSGVAATEDGFVVTGDHGFTTTMNSHVRLWTSPDGLIWNRVLDLGDGNTMAVVATESVTVLSGGIFVDDDAHSSVWTGPVFDPFDPPPDPISSEEEAATDEAARLRIWAEPAGASCEQLTATGFSYAQVVAYWNRFEHPDAMDSDANGIPCETAYPPGEVAAVFGTSDYAVIELTTGDEGFTASGGAVAAGFICPSGTNDYPDNDAGDPQALWHGEIVFTCADGSGSFTIGKDMYLRDDAIMFEYGTWTIVSGTGSYASLGGGGSIASGPDEDWMWRDTLTGRAGIE